MGGQAQGARDAGFRVGVTGSLVDRKEKKVWYQTETGRLSTRLGEGKERERDGRSEGRKEEKERGGGRGGEWRERRGKGRKGKGRRGERRGG